MIRKFAITSVALAAFCVAGFAQQDPVRVWKKEASFHGRLAKAFIKEQSGANRDRLVGLAEGLSKGSIQPDAIADEIATIANDASAVIDEIVEQEVATIASFASSAIVGPATPDSLMVGACDLIEKLMKTMNALQGKAYSATLKDIKKAIKFIEKITDHKVCIVLVPPTPVPAPAPAPVQPPPPPPKELKIRSMAGSSDTTVTSDGKLCVGGTANPLVNGGMINVTINGPGGAMMQAVTVDPFTCTWKACFPAQGAGTLPEGNYRVQADQGADNVRGTIGVPG